MTVKGKLADIRITAFMFNQGAKSPYIFSESRPVTLVKSSSLRLLDLTRCQIVSKLLQFSEPVKHESRVL